MEIDMYTARWDRTGKIVYASRPKGNLFGELPLGSWPIKLGDDPEDPFNGIVFRIDAETITVTKDRKSKGVKSESYNRSIRP
jgi:hypothetical protein